MSICRIWSNGRATVRALPGSVQEASRAGGRPHRPARDGPCHAGGRWRGSCRQGHGGL